jgi:hypothetical protein
VNQTTVPPADTNIKVRNLTVDCNSMGIWGAQQTAGSANQACVFWDNLSGLLMEDVIVKNGNLDGMALGWNHLVEHFTIVNSQVNTSGRWAVSWGMASNGQFAEVSMTGNCAGGVDEEPILVWAPTAVTFSGVTVSGPQDSSCSTIPGGRGVDSGFAIAFTGGATTSGVHLDGVTVEDVAGVGLLFQRGGNYQDVRFDGTIRNAAVLGIQSTATGYGTVSISGQIINSGESSALNGALWLQSGYESGWNIGPLLIEHSPIFSNTSDINIGSSNPDFSANEGNTFTDVTQILSCGMSTACTTASDALIYVYGGYGVPSDYLDGTPFGAGPSNRAFNSLRLNLAN